MRQEVWPGLVTSVPLKRGAPHTLLSPSQHNTNNTVTNTNPYTQHLNAKGYDTSDAKKKPKTRTFPCTIGWRTFNSQEEYDQALHDYLNGH